MAHSIMKNRMKRTVWLGLLSLVFLITPLKSYGVLSAEGFGKTPNAARENALQELSQIISSAVQSDVGIRTELRDNQVSQDVSTSIAIQSSSYFQGVEYSQPRDDNGTLRVEARLPLEAAKKTVDQLLQDIRLDMSTLSRNQVTDLLDRAVFLSAFLKFMPSNSVDEGLTQLASEKRQLAYQYLNFAQVTFNAEPKDTLITVGKYTFKVGQTQLIPPGNYQYQASADNYQTRSERLYLSAGENRQVNFKLVPRTAGQVELRVMGEPKSLLFSEAQQVLAGFGISHQPESSNSMELRFEQQFVTEISGMKFFNLRLVVEAKKQEQPIIVRRASLNNVAESLVEARIKAMTKALFEAVLAAEETQAMWQE